MSEQNHRSQPAMAVELLPEIQSVNTAITGGWVQTFGDYRMSPVNPSMTKTNS
jgi:hypothetical protein